MHCAALNQVLDFNANGIIDGCVIRNPCLYRVHARLPWAVLDDASAPVPAKFDEFNPVHRFQVRRRPAMAGTISICSRNTQADEKSVSLNQRRIAMLLDGSPVKEVAA